MWVLCVDGFHGYCSWTQDSWNGPLLLGIASFMALDSIYTHLNGINYHFLLREILISILGIFKLNGSYARNILAMPQQTFLSFPTPTLS